MIESRRCARPTRCSESNHTPSSSGPRWASARAMRPSSRWSKSPEKPAIPHMAHRLRPSRFDPSDLRLHGAKLSVWLARDLVDIADADLDLVAEACAGLLKQHE